MYNRRRPGSHNGNPCGSVHDIVLPADRRSVDRWFNAEAQKACNRAIFTAPHAAPANRLFGPIGTGEMEPRRIRAALKSMW